MQCFLQFQIFFLYLSKCKRKYSNFSSLLFYFFFCFPHHYSRQGDFAMDFFTKEKD